MSWLILALLQPLLWAALDVIEKFQLEKIFKHWVSYFTMFYVIYLSLGFAIVSFNLVTNPVMNPLGLDPLYTLIAMAAGLLYAVTIIFYLKGLSIEETSRIIPLSYIGTIFVAILAFLFLNEIFSLPKYIGMAALVAGSIAISYKKSKKASSLGSLFTPALSFIIFAAFLDAITSVLSKFFMLKYDYWSLMFWFYFGALVVTASMFVKKSNRLRFLRVKELSRRQLLFVCIIPVIYFAADLVWFVAVSEGPLSLISFLGTTEPFFVFLFTLFLSLFVPKILKEEVSRSIVYLKLVAIALIMLGAYLVAV
jgi:uncharacterized membrane protein